MSTPTFLRSYLRRCQPEHFASLDVVFGSAERLPSELSGAFEKKFGVRPLEAYGATELSPLVSVNIPPHRYCGDAEAVREGSVGRPIPGVRVKVVHPDTREDLPADQPGMLLVSGPNVMKGYLNKPDLTAEVVRDGWYTTGDIARVDGDGFIHITGRLSRFSKIGGEMVPHIKIEEALETMLGQDEEQIHAAVTAVPDAKKGERLVVIHLPLDKTPAEICRLLAARGLPNLWIPSTDSFCQVQEIPVLGSGKLDLKRLKDLAVEKFSSAAAAK
jgi:acyl-[acyl-carrier-protein]-phospholipid O-acyltransferase/long-chain-fatty-acid--[acyl-carrier-protein] ligase